MNIPTDIPIPPEGTKEHTLHTVYTAMLWNIQPHIKSQSYIVVYTFMVIFCKRAEHILWHIDGSLGAESQYVKIKRYIQDVPVHTLDTNQHKKTLEYVLDEVRIAVHTSIISPDKNI